VNNPLYLVAGFGLTWGALVWYAWRISRRTSATVADLARHRGDSGSDITP
jgi:hypothetical protein